MKIMSKVDIYTDGACLGNPGPGGWSFIIKYENGKTEEFNGSENHTTNNKMELTAAIKALTYIKEKTKVNIYTDSKYLKDGITVWINKWKLNGWKTSNKKNLKSPILPSHPESLNHLSRDRIFRIIIHRKNFDDRKPSEIILNTILKHLNTYLRYIFLDAPRDWFFLINLTYHHLTYHHLTYHHLT